MALTGNEQISATPAGQPAGPAPVDELITVAQIAAYAILTPGIFANLPTSSAGLPSGTAFNSGGFLCIVP